ncbi:MAG: hypothetical protein IIX28_00955 [Clostridia bacterium]|nr:hypothetical protein [Clostridia bacterium]
MKKAKNILLLAGVISCAIYFLWSLVRVLIDLSFAQDDNGVRFVLANQVYPALFWTLLLIFPVLLLVRNLKGKDGKTMPILSITVCAIILVVWLFTALTPAIPQYLVFSKVGLLDTYFVHVLKFMGEGGWLLFDGYVCVFIGSILSLPKRNKKEEVTQ